MEKDSTIFCFFVCVGEENIGWVPPLLVSLHDLGWGETPARFLVAV